MLDYASPFTFLFRDRAWLKKFVIASLLTYTLVGAAPVLGWMIEIVRQVGRGEVSELPDWTDWKPYWQLGGQFAFINAGWLLPFLVGTILVYLPLIFANQLQGEILLVIWGVTLLCVLLVLLIYSLIYAIFFPAMQVLLAGTGSTWQSANPVRLWKTVQAHFTQYLIVFLIVGLALFNVMLVAAALTAFLFLPPLLVYAGLVTAHYAGQLMRMDRRG